MGGNRGAQERFRREYAKAKLRVENDRAQRRHAAALAARAAHVPPKKAPGRASVKTGVPTDGPRRPTVPVATVALVLGVYISFMLAIVPVAAGRAPVWFLAVPLVIGALARVVQTRRSGNPAEAPRVRVADDDERVRVEEEELPSPPPACAECGEPVAETEVEPCASCIDPVHAGCGERHAARHGGEKRDGAYR